MTTLTPRKNSLLVLCLLFASVLFLGCESSDGALSNADTNSNGGGDASSSGGDAVSGDMGQTDSTCAYTPAREQGSLSNQSPQYVGLSNQGSPYDALLVQSYTADPYNGPTAPGTFSLDGTNFEDCGLCVLFLAECTDNECDKRFYADAGEVEITTLSPSIGSHFAATLRDVVLKEVTIDETTYRSTPVAGGEERCLNDYSFDVEFADPAASNCADPAVNCVGDTVPHFSLQNCGTEEFVNTETLNQNKLLWIVATAGWCPACHEWLPNVVSFHNDNKDGGADLMVVVGENNDYGQPDLAFCKEYAGRYADSDVNTFYIDHDGEYGYAVLFTNVWPYLDANGAFGLPWNAVLEGKTNVYKYADGSETNEQDLQTTLSTLMSAP